MKSGNLKLPGTLWPLQNSNGTALPFYTYIPYKQGDPKVSSPDDYSTKINPHATGELKMAITEYIRNVDRVILNTVFENTFRRVNRYLETGGGHFELYL
jgi:hypothetical protein